MFARWILKANFHDTTMKVLNVAEKNDAAKRIAAMLSNGNSSRREGLSKFNKIYEFNYNVLNSNSKMIMTSMSGHLMNYEFAGSYRMWSGCHPMSLFEADVHKQINPDMLQIKKTLEKEVRGCQALIIWTDCDREGENIGFEVINICRAIKPNISVHRAKFSEITSSSVRRALSNLVSPDENVSDAVDVRQELDLRCGAAFTRYQTMRLNKVFPEFLSDKLISYGPCQFPTLGFVVERYKARENFISEPFWKLEVEHFKEDCKAIFTWKRGRLFDEVSVAVLYDECMEPPCVAMVTNVASKPKSKWRPVALDTVEMEKLATRKLRMTASAAMKTAEKLYSKGFISYPRTETNIFPKDIDLNRLISEQTGNNNWGNFAQNLLEIGPTPRNGTKSDKAHPPIHPLKPADNLSGDEHKVYELVTRHFLACCHRDAQGHETTVEIDLSGEKFTAQGLMILAKNYLEVYTYEHWNTKTIPNYMMGEEFEPTKVSKINGQTTAPALLSEADLIALMDKYGIGTDATHAEHIETLKKRLYIGITNDRRLVPGELGMGLITGYNEIMESLTLPHLRSEVERDLKLICDGNISKDVVLHKYISMYKDAFEKVINDSSKLDEALETYFGDRRDVSVENMYGTSGMTEQVVRKCPSCGDKMILKKTKNGKFMVACMRYPSCTYAAFFPPSVLDAKVSTEICTLCQPQPVYKLDLKFNRRDIPLYMTENATECVCGCNPDMEELFNIRFRASAQPTANSQQTQQPRRPNNNNQQPRRRNNNNSNQQQRTSQPRQRNNSNTSHTTNGQQQIPKCRCNEDAVRRNVMKDGPNKGRGFFTCGKPRDNQCGFFEWCNDDGGGSTTTTQQRQMPSNSRPRTKRPPTCGLCGVQGHTRRSCPQK